MEVVSTVASLVALTKDIAKVSDRLVRHFRDAPKELVRLRNQSSLVFLELTYLERLTNIELSHNILPAEELQLMHHAIHIENNDITSIHESLCERAKVTVGKPPVSTRLAWALFDRKSVDDVFEQLERVENRLICVMQLASFFQQQGTNDLVLAAKEADVESTNVFRHNYSFVLGAFWNTLLKCQVELTTSNNEYQRAYELYERLPTPSLTGKMVVLVTLSMRRIWGFLPNVSVICGGLNFVNIIPVDSEIVGACQRGDLVAVQTLFSEMEAAPNDMIAERETLVSVAIQSGSTRLIRFLIEAGAPVQSYDSLLQWTSWVNSNPLTEDNFSEQHGGDNLTLLESSSAPKESMGKRCISKDVYGWAVLHRAAAWGTADDVNILLRFGTMQSLRSRRLSWTPLICAVAHKNIETLQALCNPRIERGICEEQDLRGWDLLHIAVGYVNLEAVPYLLEKGVDPEAQAHAHQAMCL
ncbi:ankyrin [Karstenula rhodostoma CBS 690.94]|uniref:Ankyrin n=1 Tax=Karstenula rhodostoma CBS 690.94 TaxID=1392251 RepID=A0A9P4PNS4_9PLEO|nr:ankyrin [Karstenula rhodostoma CBS 690.94]